MARVWWKKLEVVLTIYMGECCVENEEKKSSPGKVCVLAVSVALLGERCCLRDTPPVQARERESAFAAGDYTVVVQ